MRVRGRVRVRVRVRVRGRVRVRVRVDLDHRRGLELGQPPQPCGRPIRIDKVRDAMVDGPWLACVVLGLH